MYAQNPYYGGSGYHHHHGTLSRMAAGIANYKENSHEMKAVDDMARGNFGSALYHEDKAASWNQSMNSYANPNQYYAAPVYTSHVYPNTIYGRDLMNINASNYSPVPYHAPIPNVSPMNYARQTVPVNSSYLNSAAYNNRAAIGPTYNSYGAAPLRNSYSRPASIDTETVTRTRTHLDANPSHANYLRQDTDASIGRSPVHGFVNANRESHFIDTKKESSDMFGGRSNTSHLEESRSNNYNTRFDPYASRPNPSYNYESKAEGWDRR